MPRLLKSSGAPPLLSQVQGQKRKLGDSLDESECIKMEQENVQVIEPGPLHNLNTGKIYMNAFICTLYL